MAVSMTASTSGAHFSTPFSFSCNMSMNIGMDMDMDMSLGHGHRHGHDVEIDIGRDIFETEIFVIGQSIALKLVHPITDQT